MLAFELKDVTREQTMRVIDALKLCSCAESLGSLETLVTHPATASHCDVPPDDPRTPRRHRSSHPHVHRH